MKPIIIDNFFDNPNAIRKYALQAYYTPLRGSEYGGYLKKDAKFGYRTNIYSREILFQKNVIDKICDFKIHNKKITNAKVSSHFSPEHVMGISENFHTLKMHTDSVNRCDAAGVVYLTPNPPANSGTCIDEYGCVENKYNRFVCYPSNVLHGPDHLFGQTKNTSRLTITFFLYY